MKRLVLSIILAAICGISAFAANNYDFSKASNGKTLYYKITSSTSPYTVQVVPENSSSPYYTTYPTGGLEIPESVEYNSITYSVTSIGSGAFYACSGLTSITIPESVTSIGPSAFYGCSGLTEPVYNANYFVYFPCGYATTYTIPNGIQHIAASAFSGCSGLTSITIPNSVTSIGGSAFSSCSGLTSVTIPNSVTSIGTYAFSRCSGLTSVTIGNSVTSIGNDAFSSCIGLTSVTIPNSVTSIGEYAFFNCGGLTDTLTIPNSVTSIGKRAFANCRGLTSVTIGNSVTSIGDAAFCQCQGLAGELIIPNSVITIGSESDQYGVFWECFNITSVTIGNSVETIGMCAFEACRSLTSITIPESVTSIYDDAFKSCTALTTVNFNAENCTTMGSSSNPVFSNCTSLSTLNIGENVTNILDYAFYGCSGLTNIYSNPTASPSIQTNTFDSYTATLWVPCGSATVYSSATGWSNFSDIQNDPTVLVLNVQAANSDMGSVSGGGNYSCEAEAILVATPNEGYNFVQWNDGNAENPRTITVTQDTVFTASFGVPHTIAVVSSNEDYGTVSGNGSYLEGSQIEISATANEHYHFVQWNDGNTENPRTITVLSDSTFTATFAIDQHTITVSANNDEMGTVSGGNTYDYGTEIQISATANEHYHFVFWNDGNTENPRTITVESDTTFTATFAANEFTITVATETSRTNSEPTFIPDGPNCTTQCYTSDITFSDFNEDAVVDNADAIKYVRLNMEHSFIGDLQIKITCPEDANHNRRSAIMLQDYYSNESGNDLYRSNAIDVYTYNWPYMITTTDYYYVGPSLSSHYTGNYLIGSTSCTPEGRTCTSNGYTYYFITFRTSADALNYVHTYLERYFSGHEYTVYSINSGEYYAIAYTVTDDQGSTRYYVYMTNDETTGDDAYTFLSEEAAQYYLNTVIGGIGVISSASTSHHYTRVHFGEPDYYDVRDATNITTGQICDDTDPHNLAGIGYDYAWTSNSQYNTIGYVYDLGNINAQSIFYNNGVFSDSSIYHILPSDVETGVQMYQPFQSFNNLVGCPLNGTWTISVCDSWAYDNGYVFDWEIAILGDGNNMGTVAGGGTYNEGEEISISATPAEHYHFVSWNDGNTENPRIVTVTEDATYSAIFAIDQHTIMVESADEPFGTVSGGGTYDYGTESLISATANEHYHFVQWNDGNMENPRTITVAGDVTYTATFAIDQFAVTVVSANESMGTVSGSGTYNYGTETQISATPTDHYHFVSWNDGNTENPRTITVESDSTFTVNFAIDQFTVTVESVNETMGTVIGSGTFDYGTETQISATPAEHHHFVSWNDGNTDNPRTITVSADTTYTATFAVDVTNYTITAVSANPNYGTVTGGGTYAEGTEITLTAMPNEGYEFVQWNDESTENPRTITVTENAIYIATFAAATIPTIYNEFTAAACESYAWNDSIYTESGDYTQTFMAASSADSIVTLHLTIYPLPQPEITVDGILDACNPETASVTLSTEEYDSYVWSNGEIASAIEVTEPNVYYVEVVDGHGCHGVSEMTTVGYSSVLTEAPQIRLVGMSSSGKNVLLWNVASTEGIAGYEIYREDNVANVFNCIDRIERPNARNYIDLTSEPGARAYRYRICSFDECGGRSPMSDFHKTMHLTINRGVGTNWNLIWSHYEGLEFDTYKIYRGTSPRDMVMIGEMPSTLNSFTDLTNTLEEGMYYRVEIVTNNGAKNEDVSLSSNIVANEFVDNYTITAISNNESFGTVSGSGTYPAEIDITLVAIPNEGYEFVSWSDGNTENLRVITVNESATYIATFVEAAPIENYTITVVSANPEYGTVTGGGTYPEGAIISIEAIANEGYRFVQWSDGNTDNPREITVMGNATYEASFEEISSVTSYTISAVSANPEYGTVTGGGTYAEGTVVSLIAEANEGYRFVQWSDGNTDNPREITVTGDAIYVALFAEIPPATTYTITAVSANPEYGTVTGGGTYAEGTVVTLTAEANDGYQFLQWNDNSTDNPREITVTGDAMYIATFAPQTSIEENGLPEIAVFPNPANDFIIISSSETISEIEIVNVIGQVVMHLDVNADNVVCDVEGLKAGMYFVRIYGTDATTTIAQRKFVKE